MSVALDTGTIALVVPTSTAGGAEMRFAALEKALADGRRCVRLELTCDRILGGGCTCTAPGPDDALEEPWWFDRTYCPHFAAVLDQRLRELRPAAVVFSTLDTYTYVVHFAGRLRCPIVFDMHNVEMPLHRDIYAALPPSFLFNGTITQDYVRRIAVAESQAIRHADEVWVCSPQDGQLVEREYQLKPGARLRIVPNVVPVDEPRADAGEPSRVSFVGRLDYCPNIKAAWTLIEHIAPALPAKGCCLPVVVAGANPAKELRRLGEVHQVRIVPDPASVGDIIGGSIMVAPLTEGGGSRFKILQAFAAGSAVVSTSKGVEGLAVRAGEHFLLADTADEFAVQISRLARHDDLRRDLVRQAWELVRDRYSIAALRRELAAQFRTRPLRQSAAGAAQPPVS